MPTAAGQLRRRLRRNTDLNALSAANNTPRKCLDYQTPAEVLHNQLLRLQSDSSFLPAQE